MARTAPVPNIPAIPGMCPGIAVLGGGGGSGGKGGKGAGQGGGGNGADGEGGAEDTADDGRNAGACGAGAPGSCTGCGKAASAGDPVDVVTGRVYSTPAVDLLLPGPLPLRLVRSYNSSAALRDGPLGFGWSHSLGWSIEVRRAAIRVFNAEGDTVDFDLIEPGGVALSRGGWVLRRESWGFYLDCGDDLWRIFADKDDDGRHFRISALDDRNKNRIELRYDGGRLQEIVDSAGRVVRVRLTAEGRIESLAVANAPTRGRWVPFARYEYSKDGDLVAVTDADGFTTRFQYADHRLTGTIDPNGLMFHFIYDGQQRCVETWGDYPNGRDDSLADDLSPYLADGVTLGKGVLHVKITYGEDHYSEVVDSVAVRRIFGNELGKVTKGITGGACTTREFDEYGHMIERIDAEGNTTRYTRDRRGRLLSRVNPLGARVELSRDDYGAATRVLEPGGAEWVFDRDLRGNIVLVKDANGSTSTYRYDSRGLCMDQTSPTGAMTRFAYDEHGNLIEMTQPNGGVWRWSYDGFGRALSCTDPLGGETRASFTDAGRPTAVFYANGGIERTRFDGLNQLIHVTDPAGQVYEFAWSGFGEHCSTTLPNGDVIRQRYNREGWLVTQYNEKGEQHRYDYDDRGNVIREMTFDGRQLEYHYDLVNRLAWGTNGIGEKIEVVHDAAGAVVEIIFPDGDIETFQYDPNGRLMASRGPNCQILYELDAMGNTLRETQIVLGEMHTIEYEYDASQQRTRRRTSLGHELTTERDSMGDPIKRRLDGDRELAYQRDLIGQTLATALPNGGVIGNQYDMMGAVSRRRVEQAGAAGLRSSNEPAWLGAAGAGDGIDKRFHYRADGELLSITDAHRGYAEFRYDLRSRLLEVDAAEPAVPGMRPRRSEAFRYDSASNVYPPEARSGPTQYGPGNRLLQRDQDSYDWDDDGRLVAKRVKTAEGEEKWAYEWDGRGHLARVVRPDGDEVSFYYDAFARRMLKKVKPAAGGSAEVTRFVWDGDDLVHEIKRRASAAGDEIIQERTYLFDGEGVPIAHCDRQVAKEGANDEQAEQALADDWFYYVGDHIDTPEELVTDSGAVAARLTRDAWGVTNVEALSTDTPLRFRGQYEDAETGLAYNRHRYYDPQARCYISADPIGLDGNINGFGYCTNPISWMDPFGLHDASATLKLEGGTPVPLANPDGGGSNFPSGYDDHCRAIRAAKPGTGGRKAADRESHSERKMIRALEGRNDLENSELHITGDARSCHFCSSALEKLAKKKKMKIVYSSPGQEDLVLDYSNGNSSSNRTAYNARTKALKSS